MGAVAAAGYLGIAAWVLSFHGMATKPYHIIKAALMMVTRAAAGLVAFRLTRSSRAPSRGGLARAHYQPFWPATRANAEQQWLTLLATPTLPNAAHSAEIWAALRINNPMPRSLRVRRQRSRRASRPTRSARVRNRNNVQIGKYGRTGAEHWANRRRSLQRSRGQTPRSRSRMSVATSAARNT
jgi:hypothetical protein